MSATYGMTAACRYDMATGVHQPGDTYMLALYSERATLNAHTEVYDKADEVKGQGYVAGGKVLSGYHCELVGMKACIGWDRVVIWKNATISARTAVLYNKSKGNRVLAILDPGMLTASTNGDWKMTLPAHVLWVGE